MDANFKCNSISDQYDRQESSPSNTKNLVHVNVGFEVRLLEIIHQLHFSDQLPESKVKGKEKPTKAVTPSVKVVFRTKSRT